MLWARVRMPRCVVCRPRLSADRSTSASPAGRTAAVYCKSASRPPHRCKPRQPNSRGLCCQSAAVCVFACVAVCRRVSQYVFSVSWCVSSRVSQCVAECRSMFAVCRGVCRSVCVSFFRNRWRQAKTSWRVSQVRCGFGAEYFFLPSFMCAY